MKLLSLISSLISTAVLACLVLAAPAAAAEPTITITPNEVVTGQAITFQVSGVNIEPRTNTLDYTVNLLLGTNACQKRHSENTIIVEQLEAEAAHKKYDPKPTKKESLQTTMGMSFLYGSTLKRLHHS